MRPIVRRRDLDPARAVRSQLLGSLQARHGDQTGLGAVNVGLAPEEISVRRPPSDCPSAGQVLVFDAGRNFSKALPCRRRQEDDRQS